MIWSTGGSVTDSILRYRDIGHVINTLSCDTSFVVSSLRVVCTVVVRVFLSLLNVKSSETPYSVAFPYTGETTTCTF